LPEIDGESELEAYIRHFVFVLNMQFCDECGSMMHAEGDA